MRSSPTVAQLRAFVAVADLQHFREAASSLRVSQPTLSQALSTLEENLNVRLIERSPRRVFVTPDGERLLPLARDVLDAVEAFRSAALPDTWLSGPLHMGVIPTIAPYLLPTLLPALRIEAPELELHVHEEQTHRLVTGLTEGSIDLAILALPVDDSRLGTMPLYEEDFVLAVPPGHAWAGVDDVTVADVPSDDLLLLDEGHCLRDQVVAACLSSGVSRAGASGDRAASLPTIVQLVAAGLGMTFLPETAVSVETRGAHLGVARFAGPVPGRQIVLAHRRSCMRTDEFEDFAEILRRAMMTRMPFIRRAGSDHSDGQ